jgi:hypothetical protein
MTTTLTVQPLPEVAAVLLTVTGAPAGALTIMRADSNGARPVRLLPDQAPIGGSLTTRDYEPALSGTVTYSLGGVAAVGDPLTLTATTTLDLGGFVASIPVRPARQVLDGVLTSWTEARESSAIVHEVPDRADPIVLAGKLRLRTGQGAARFSSYAQAAAMRDLPAEGHVVQLRMAPYPGMDAYVRVTRPELRTVDVPGVGVAWEVSYAYTEVAAPDAALLGAADWTLGDVAATVPTLGDLAATFTTLRDLAVGP